MITLSGLYRYPCKSLAGLTLESAQVEPRGLQGDRRWMVVDEGGLFLTQRRLPGMALVSVIEQTDGVFLAAPGAGSVRLPAGGGEPLPVTIWGDTLSAQRCGEEVEAWLSKVLDHPCRVVYMPDELRRPVDLDYGTAVDQVSFADGFPLLLISEGSLQALNERLVEPVRMAHFRPNLVVSGCEPFAEDEWREIRIGEVSLRLVKPCSRCVITTIDPATGKGDPQREPLRTLAQFRRRDGQVYFGQNVIPSVGGELQLGMPVEVLA